MNYWEWIRKGKISKSLAVRPGARDGLAYGDGAAYDQVAPIRQENFRGEGFVWSEVETLIAIVETPADQSGGVYTLTDHLGNSWQGPLLDVEWDPVSDGGTIYWVVTIIMFSPVKLS